MGYGSAMSFFTTFVRNRAASWRKRPVRSLLFGVTLFLMLDIGRYLVWPPVGWLETEQPRTTSFMEYRQEQWQNGPRAKDGKGHAYPAAVGPAQAHCSGAPPSRGDVRRRSVLEARRIQFFPNVRCVEA